MQIKYYDVRMDEEKEEKGLTPAEYNSRMGDLRMMELGGHIIDIQGEVEDED